MTAFAIFWSLVGALVGAISVFWFAKPGTKSVLETSGDKAREASDVLARLRDLAIIVAGDLDHHHDQLDEINGELATIKNHDAKDVVKAVVQLVEFNEKMQSRLDNAEDKLRVQAQQIESHAAEARTDALTLLANRRAFDDEIARRFAEVRRQGGTFSLIFIDVDHFKKFNDAHGHLAGDKVLRNVARVLRRNMRTMDLISRYGGEEFAIILPGTAIENAKRATIRAREAIENAACVVDETPLKITASFGVAQLLADPDTTDLVKRVDAALYRSKEAGRNCAHWHDGIVSHLIVEQENHAEQRQQKTTGPPSDAADPAASPAASTTQPSGELTDRVHFCNDVRRRLAEWKRGGVFSIIILEIHPSDPTKRARPQTLELASGATAKLALALARTEDLVARFHLDRFVLLFPGAPLKDIVSVADRLRQTASEEVGKVAGKRFALTAGAAEAAEGDDPTELLRRADAALDAGRRNGGNCTYHHDGERCAPISELQEAAPC